MMFLILFICQIVFTTGDIENSITTNPPQISQSSTLSPASIETTTNFKNATNKNETDIVIATKFISIPSEKDIIMPADLSIKQNATENTNNSTDTNFSVFVTLNPGRQLSLEHLNMSCTACNTSDIQKSNLTFKWFLNGQVLQRRRDLIFEGNSIPECNNSLVSFIGLSNLDSGTLVCSVTDEISNVTRAANYTLNLPAPPLVSLEEFPLPLKINQTVNISCLSYIPTRMPEGYLSAATISLAGHIVLMADDTFENSIPFRATEKLRLNAGQEFKRISKEVAIPFNAESLEVTCFAANDFGRFSTGKFVVPIHSHNNNNMNPVNIL